MDIQDLLTSLRLADVRTIVCSGALKLTPTADNGLAKLGEIDPNGATAVNVNPVSWGQRLETWFQLTITSDQFDIQAAVAVLYDRDTSEPIPDEVRVDFIEKVAVMTAYPYLRALIQDLAAELRVGIITLAILPQGGFRLGPPQAATDSAPPT